MEMNFNMTARDYYTATRTRNKKLNDSKSKIVISVLLCFCCVFLSVMLFAVTKDVVYLGICIALFAAIMMFNLTNTKKTVMKTFDESPVAQSMHTIRTYNDGLEIINSYEKIFVPWQSIYMIEDTATHFVIMPTYTKGAIAIDKQKFASPQLDGIIAEIKSRRNNV